VFTARYALSPYIKQIRFVFKGLVCRCAITCDVWVSCFHLLACEGLHTVDIAR
jgi:hypothetical protein